MGVSIPTIGLILAGISTATGIATTASALSKGAPDLPTVQPALPPPAPPPVPDAPPMGPTETAAGEAVGKERRKRAARFGIEQTLLSPLGASGGVARAGRTLLGG